MSRRIPEEVIENVRSNVNIVDVVSQYVQLSKSGKNFFGLCPFHEEKTPSFSVSEEKQIFHCFSCHRGGNVFKFIMEVENVSFPEAVLRVAELGNVQLDDELLKFRSDSTENESSDATKLKNLYNEAAKLFHHILVNTVMGEDAMQYLLKRGLTAEMITEFNLGFAPDKQLLLPFLQEKKADQDLLHRSGLFIETTEGKLRERFRNRIIFPIRDAQERTVAFSGRLLEKNSNLPKYLNSPETAIFNKRKLLFNFDKAKGEIRQKKFAILFEGFMDVLAAYRSGIKNGVASMGTSLTNEQVYLLERATQKLYICYDGDVPGQTATARALSLLDPVTKMTLGVIRMPEALDPDEYVQKYGTDAFKEIAQNTHETALAFYLHYYEQGRNLDNEDDQLAYLADVLKQLAQVISPVEQDIYLNQLAKRFGLEKSSLLSQLNEFIRKTGKNRKKVQATGKKGLLASNPEKKKSYDKVEKAERLLLYRLLHSANIRLKLRQLTGYSFVHDAYQELYTIAEGYFNVYPEYETARFLDFLDDDGLRQLLIELELENYSREENEEEFSDCVSVIMRQSPLEQHIKEIKQQLADAKRMNNEKLITKLTIELVALLRRQQEAKSASL
ncbi:DNA primase [Liquorilactobacillus oeni]|uniref:DNA primase n=1 Tax=Liquorilactobacillus oeni TaxID=303241 RepID=UPI00070B7EBF|nr:DNA primase [Liquorilactobacillus oeni]